MASDPQFWRGPEHCPGEPENGAEKEVHRGEEVVGTVGRVLVEIVLVSSMIWVT